MANMVSVIVPIYNGEQYINSCVKSVLKQTYTDYELILIDDGSEDRSREICERLCEKDKRIRLILQEHKGVSAARNTGIDASTGKYLFFLDSDDIIHPQLLEALCNLQERYQTMIATVSLYYAEADKFQKPVGWKYEDIDTIESFYLKSGDAKKHQFFTHKKTMLYAIGGKLILRATVNSQRFDEELTHGEDTRFVYQLLYGGADVSVLLRSWYYYRRPQNKGFRVFSVDMCRSKYRAATYIRDRQIEEGMVSDAAYTECDLLGSMIEWNESGKRVKDVRLLQYMRKIIEKEKRSWIFLRVRCYRRILFYLGCEHYSIYDRIAKVFEVYYKVNDKYRKIMKRDIL